MLYIVSITVPIQSDNPEDAASIGYDEIKNIINNRDIVPVHVEQVISGKELVYIKKRD